MIHAILAAGAFVTSLLVGLAVIPFIWRFCKNRGLYDLPDARKRHHTAVPRLGGIAFLPSMGFSFIVAVVALSLFRGRASSVSISSIYLLTGVVTVYCVGVVDDIFGVSARKKFVAQIAGACFLLASNLYINNLYGFLGIWQIPAWVGMPLTLFLVVFIDNAMNLIDGIDGLCAGLAMIALAGFGVMFARLEMWVFCVMIAGLIGVLAAYCYFNVFSKRRKIFMGDSGSLTIGFILAVLFTKLSMNNPLVMEYDAQRMMMAYSMLIVPCFDVVRVVLVRLRQRKPIFSPDRNHIHHKLMDCGLSPHRALAAILLLALAYIVLNGVMLHLGVQPTVVVAADIAAYIAFHCALRARHKA